MTDLASKNAAASSRTLALDSERGAARQQQDGASGERQSDAGDLQSLLSDALRRLAETTGSGRACAWTRRSDGQPHVIAATYRDTTPPESPDAAALDTLDCLYEDETPVDLGAHGGKAALSQVGVRYGFSSAMPLVSTHGEHIAVILLGGTDDPPGNVRPRTLAALGATVARLRTPTAAATALVRLTKIDDEVCRLDRLAVLGDLLAEVAHEIRNPLVSMKTFLHLLPDRIHDAEFQGEFRDVVLEELQRMERLLDTLLDHARPVANRIASETPHAAANLNRVYASLLRLLEQRATERNVSITAEISAASHDIAIGEDALRQILLNLFLSAIEAAPRSTTVTLRAGLFDTTIDFSVEDEGAGVSPAARERLFEPFFSTREDRAGGLGLAITKKLVEDAGGAIRADTAASGGAKFCVSLPRLSLSGS